MRYQGHNVLAIVVAAIVIYVIEFLIFGLAIPAEQYEAMVGLTAEQLHPERMPYGIIPPVLTAIGLSIAVKWRNAAGWMAGAMTGVLMAVFFAFATSLYPFVYGSNTETFLAVNLGHYLVCYAAAGAILGVWK
jgi:cytochrome bd-type quinol oxidase subunit 2